jgi:hypothetical protein
VYHWLSRPWGPSSSQQSGHDPDSLLSDLFSCLLSQGTYRFLRPTQDILKQAQLPESQKAEQTPSSNGTLFRLMTVYPLSGWTAGCWALCKHWNSCSAWLLHYQRLITP